MYILFILLVIFILYLLYTFPVIQVVGMSMYPTYKDGEFLLSHRVLFRNSIKKGDVLVLKSPDEPRKAVIKRVESIERNGLGLVSGLYVLGDNRNNSYDSRNYGVIHVGNIISKPFNQRPIKE